MDTSTSTSSSTTIITMDKKGSWKQQVASELKKRFKQYEGQQHSEATEVPPLPESHKARKVSDDQLGPCKLADFEVIRIIGTGSFGRVSVARHIKTAQVVAIKCLSKAAVIRDNQVQHVADERDMLRQVSGHPFIVNLRSTFQDARHIYITLDFVPGGEFFTHLRDHGRLREEHARFYVAQIVLALEYLHTKRIAYRDLKPENLLIGADGYIKVTDFGFAKSILTKTHTVCGTPDYLAPEVIKGAGHTTHVDWWSLGCVMHEMLSGFPPFYTGQAVETYKRIAALQYTFPNYFSPYAKDLITRFLNPDPSQRFGCTKEGVAAIKSHIWFQHLDWSYVLQKAYKAPYIPAIKSADDTSCFDKYDNLPPIKHPFELTPEQQQLFAGF